MFCSRPHRLLWFHHRSLHECLWLVGGPGSAVDVVENVFEDLGAILDLFKLLQLPESLATFRLPHCTLLQPRQHPGHRDSESGPIPSTCGAVALFRLAVIPLGDTPRRQRCPCIVLGRFSVGGRSTEDLISFFDRYIDVVEGSIENLLPQMGHLTSFYGLTATEKRRCILCLIHAMEGRVLISDRWYIGGSSSRRLPTKCKLVLVFLGSTLRSHTRHLWLFCPITALLKTNSRWSRCRKIDVNFVHGVVWLGSHVLAGEGVAGQLLFAEAFLLYSNRLSEGDFWCFRRILTKCWSDRIGLIIHLLTPLYIDIVIGFLHKLGQGFWRLDRAFRVGTRIKGLLITHTVPATHQSTRRINLIHHS